jgi:hypothetical protein
MYAQINMMLRKVEEVRKTFTEWVALDGSKVLWHIRLGFSGKPLGKYELQD